MKAFVFDSAKCNGCYGCQLACKDENVNNEWLPYSMPQPDTGHFWCGINETVHGQTPKVRVEYRIKMCNHCDNAPCIEAAPDVVYKREDGLVIIDPAKAKGRRDIMDSCPYGAIYWNEELDIPQKCTGCAHLVDEGELPHCVDHCPQALRFGDEEELAEELKDAVRLTAPEHGGRVFYKNLPGLFISGEVWDPEPNEIIEGAKVRLSGMDGNIIEETTSDGFGDFWFRKLEPGTYVVTIEADGYQQVNKEIELEKSLNIGDFPMKKV